MVRIRRRRKAAVETSASPTLVGDTYWGGARPADSSAFLRVWRARFGAIGRTFTRAARWLGGSETRSETRSLTSVPWAQGGTLGSPQMSIEAAVKLSPVFAAGRLLSSSIASMPIQVYRKTGERRDPVNLPSLFISPSVNGTTHDWVWRAVTSMAYRGNAVGLITTRDAQGVPTTIEWLNPSNVLVQEAAPYGPGSFFDPLWYWYGRLIPKEDIVHIPWFVQPGKVWGLSPIAAYAQILNVGLGAQQYSADWFDSGGVPVGTFKNAQETVASNDANVIKERLVQSIKTHQPIVYGKDWDYTPVNVSLAEAKFIETMRLTASQIAAIYGIPPEMIGGEVGGSFTYSSPEQRSIELIQFSLLPWVTKLEDALSRLLPRNQYVKFNVDYLIRVDQKTRFENYEKARLIGAMNVDQIRALEDMPPLPDGKGEDYTPLTQMPNTTVTVPQVRASNTRTDDNG